MQSCCFGVTKEHFCNFIFFGENKNSIYKITDVCNIIIGKVMYKLTNIKNNYSECDLPTYLFDDFEKFKI